jgi:hypothetical protein
MFTLKVHPSAQSFDTSVENTSSKKLSGLVKEKPLQTDLHRTAKPEDFLVRKLFEQHDEDQILQSQKPKKRTMSHHQVVVLEPDEKALKRLTHCLVACGIRESRIRSVRLPHHVGYAIDKYKPTLVFLDFMNGPDSMGVQTLRRLKPLPCVQHWNLLMSLPAEDLSLREKVKETLQKDNLSVFYKPINRFELLSMLNELADSEKYDTMVV